MRPHRVLALLVFLFVLAGAALPSEGTTSHRRGRSRVTTHPARIHATHAASRSTRKKAVGVVRDSRGRIRRSEEAKRAFMQETGYPHGRPGYVVDHIRPLACGGADAPSNMQWQTKAAAKAKDRVERKGC